MSGIKLSEGELRAIRSIVAAVAFIIALISLGVVRQKSPCLFHIEIVIGLWTIGPPTWFALEHWLVGKSENSQQEMEKLKTGQELAGKFWAAIAASLFAIYQLYNK